MPNDFAIPRIARNEQSTNNAPENRHRKVEHTRLPTIPDWNRPPSLGLQ
jgi:hypothetical protein